MAKIFIPLLTLIAAFASGYYLFFMAENRYLAESQFSVVIEEQSNVDVSMGLQSILSGDTLGSSDTQAAIGYIQSANLLLELEKDFDLISHYSSPKRDWIFKLRADEKDDGKFAEMRNTYYFFPLRDVPSVEDRLKYYRSKFSAKYNATTGLVDLVIETYSPELSHQISLAILKKTEAFINTQNQEIAQEQLKFSNLELKRAQELVKTQEKALLEFQNTHKIIQPEVIIQAQLAAIQTLKLEKIHKEIELTTVRASSPRSPLIRSLQTTLRELESEISSQEASLSGHNQQKLNQLLVEFKELSLNLEFAIQLKKGAEILLEKARADAASNTRFFSVIQSPYLPEEETYPRRWYLLLSACVVVMLSLIMIQALFKSVYDRS